MKASPRFLLPAFAIAVLGLPGSAEAIPVFDLANVTQTTATAISTAATLIQAIQQVRHLETQIANQVQNLRSLDPTSFNGLLQAIMQGQYTYGQITGEIQGVGYSIKAVNDQFSRLLPSDREKWKNVRASDFDRYYSDWQSQISNSAKATARAQASLQNAEMYNQQAAAILRQSQGADGDVRQLQSINEMLGVMQSQMTNLLQSLTTANRLAADAQAVAANEKMMAEEASHRRMQDYTNEGRQVQPLKKLP